MRPVRPPRGELTGMAPWLRERGTASTSQSRTAEQRAWDSAVLACSEFVRRLTNYDEVLAGALHHLLTPTSEAAETKET